MFKNYLLIAWRNLKRNKLFTGINIFGLAVGIACFFLAVLYIRFEYSFENYHENRDRIYRIVNKAGLGGATWHNYISGDPIEELRTSFPDVEDAVKVTNCGSNRIALEGEVFRDIKMLCSESSLFNIFSFGLNSPYPASGSGSFNIFSQGLASADPETVLDRPDTAVITRSLALKLFGNVNPVGRTLPIQFGGEDREFVITGVMPDVPPNTHFTFDLMLSYESLRSTNRCLDCGQPMYVMLKDGADPESISERIFTLLTETQGKDRIEEIALEPLLETHFSDIDAERQGDMRYVYILSVIAIAILLIACANYMNLATAYFTRRAREIGVRKVLGANRVQLARQLLLETTMLTLLALPIGFLLLNLLLPAFNSLAESDIVLGTHTFGTLGLVVLGMLILIGVLAGSYPALFLSSFQPVAVLKGRMHLSRSATGLRKGLVVFQFLVSMIMICFITVVVWQLHYVQQKKLGFDSEQVLVIQVADPILSTQGETLKQEFLRVPSVKKAAAGYGAPGQIGFVGARFIHKLPDGSTIPFMNPSIDSDFIDAMNIPLIAGRNITEYKRGQDGLETIINETSVRVMGWSSPEEALGNKITWGPIVGVVKDFHFQSLHHEIGPLLMVQNQNSTIGRIMLQIEGGDVAGTLDQLEQTWNRLGSDHPFEYSFLTDELNQLYLQEQRTAQIITLFAGLSILIACLGLLGLATFMAERRTKEIGIRKVLGASIRDIVYLLSKDFGRLVLIAVVLGVPAAYLIVQRWLEEFVYRIEVSPVIFGTAALVVIVLAIVATGAQSIRAALRNPSDSLRYE